MTCVGTPVMSVTGIIVSVSTGCSQALITREKTPKTARNRVKKPVLAINLR
jgi:hypothetical protein